MNQPLYELQIHFKQVNCLGEQLAMVLEKIKIMVDKGVWYACDVDTTCDNLKIEHLMNYFPRRIGSIDDLIYLAHSVDQFLKGVFLLMPIEYGLQLDVEYGTEDEQFRDIGNAILEIRAFDTTWFMVYSNDRKIIDWLEKCFKAEFLMRGCE